MMNLIGPFKMTTSPANGSRHCKMRWHNWWNGDFWQNWWLKNQLCCA